MTRVTFAFARLASKNCALQTAAGRLQWWRGDCMKLRKTIGRMLSMCPAAWYIFITSVKLTAFVLLCAFVLLLGWGGKTITRYESHQVQDIAHDTILRKLAADPEWFLQLLKAKKESLPSASYEKYFEAGTVLFEQEHDQYLKSAIMARYARFLHNPEANGNKELSLDIVADMIRYYANSVDVISLYLVKLMKLLWYGDALSYKRRGHAISGLTYRALPMGAVPVAYESIIDLSTICYEEVDMGDGTGCRFLPSEDREYRFLTPEDVEILDAVIQRFGRLTRNEIVDTMHKEDAYTETAPHDIILFKYAKTLSMA